MIIKVLCAWCGRVLGSKQDPGKACSGMDDPVSHSICSQCMERELSDIRSASVQEIKPKSRKE